MISNLGVVALDANVPVHPVAMWGPMLLAQAEGECVIGVTTYEGACG